MELIPDLWFVAHSSDKMKHCKLIINCTSNVCDITGAEIMHFSRNDMQLILDKINEYLKRNKAVYVIGDSRFEIAECFLMRFGRMSRDDAVSIIRSKISK